MANNKNNKSNEVGAPSNGMKKVLMLSTDQNIFKEGSEVRSRMIEYGNLFEELHIIVFTARKSEILNSKSETNFKIQISKNVWAYPTNTLFKPFYFLNAYKIAKKIIASLRETSRREENYVISAQDPFEIGLAGYLLKKKFQLPLQIQIHTDFLSPYFRKESFKNKIRVLLAKWLLPKADKIRVVSQRIKNSLASKIKCPTSDVAILPIFVDAEKIKSAPIKTDLHQKYSNHDFIILMASRLTKEKNIVLALEAFAGVKCQMSDVKCLLLIVGDGPALQKLKVKCHKLNVATNVSFEPWTDDLASYYKTADLFLLTSNYEGYGRTVVEAAAGGLPTIMTDVGLAGDFLKNDFNGLVVPVNDKNALINAINGMIKNREKLKKFSQNNEKEVNLLITKEEYLKKYAQIL